MRRRAREKGQEQAWAVVLFVTGLGVGEMVYVWETVVGVLSLRDCASLRRRCGVCSNVFFFVFLVFWLLRE